MKAMVPLLLHENPSFCYQCAKCSAGCPVAEEMDLLPHQVIHAVALGEEAEVLDAETMWICAGCYTCAVRCPNDTRRSDDRPLNVQKTMICI